MLSRLKTPLSNLPNRGQVWSWISFDVANQSFTLIINTLLFSIFFKEVVVRDPAIDDQLWSLLYAGSMLLVVIASPIAGAIADARSWKKPGLMITGFVCAALTCALALIEPGAVVLAALLYVPANFAFNLGENFLAAFLPQLARRDDFGKISGFSWAVAYSGALLMLALAGAAMLLLNLSAPDTWRPFFVAAGIWFFAFAIPTLLFLKEDRVTAQAPLAGAIHDGFKRLVRTAREAARFRDLFTLLLASFFYGGAMSVIVAFASILAAEFGFGEVKLVLFVGVITVTGIAGTLLPTFLQDRFGHKRSTLVFLVIWLVTALFLAWTAHHRASLPAGTAPAAWPIWLAGNLIGLGLGALGAANRAFVGFLTPPSRSAEFFGLWGMVFKAAAILTIPFAAVKDRIGTPEALLVLAGMVVIGLVITLLVNEERGARAATAIAHNPDPS